MAAAEEMRRWWSNLEAATTQNVVPTRLYKKANLSYNSTYNLSPNSNWSSFLFLGKNIQKHLSALLNASKKISLPDSIRQFLVRCLRHQSLQLALGDYAHWWDKALESWVHTVDDSSKSCATDSWHKWIRPKQQKRKQCKRPSTHLWPGIQKASCSQLLIRANWMH